MKPKKIRSTFINNHLKMEDKKWNEINSKKDLPKDKKAFYWWVNRANGHVFPSDLGGLLGRDVLHFTFSHYMLIENVPNAPKERKQIPQEKFIEERDKIVSDKFKKLLNK